MGLRLTDRGVFLEFEQHGLFDSIDRLERLYAGMAAAGQDAKDKPILISFLFACFIENNAAARADFLATLITHPFFQGRRIAFVGVTDDDVQTALVAGHVRRVEVAVFDRRDDAIEWITSPTRPA